MNAEISVFVIFAETILYLLLLLLLLYNLHDCTFNYSLYSLLHNVSRAEKNFMKTAYEKSEFSNNLFLKGTGK